MDIGETLSCDPEVELLPFVEIDPPTVMMSFSVNDGPMAGREGDRVTSREIRDRLLREARTNISIKLEDMDGSADFKVNARGAMQVAVVVEEMRREGFEILVSRPTVIKKTIDGRSHEPFAILSVLREPVYLHKYCSIMDTIMIPRPAPSTARELFWDSGFIYFEFCIYNLFDKLKN